jgi:hypothetical protein
MGFMLKHEREAYERTATALGLVIKRHEGPPKPPPGPRGDRPQRPAPGPWLRPNNPLPEDVLK